eukprot:gnl/TRDRNA2_/TRDRNA2_164857_c0_seq1.p1 gnl/TRDRNA2_/TRDRNA2_164857_c0~~gnl/TRDRNA2_/TRDRNA2_164857_c0_seq1.p1  ORF type:complete len:178 (-),score=15.53 gnl/TRDRNA2_/TRDRNA2_164857_c0_seq1:928-1461(-)
MISSIMPIILLTFVAVATAQELVPHVRDGVQDLGKLPESFAHRVRKASPKFQEDMDSTVLGKSAHVAASVAKGQGALLPRWHMQRASLPPCGQRGSAFTRTVPCMTPSERYTQRSSRHQLGRAASEVTDVVSNLASKRGSASVIRSTMVTNAKGERVSLDSAMGTGTSIVIFLRHLG